MTRKSLLVGSAAALALVVTACGEKPDAANAEAAAEAPAEEANLPEISVSDAELEGNPFRQEWDTPYGVPPFAEIEDAHYMPATKKAILELRADIDAIVSNPEEPDFENTIVALDTAGASLNRVLGVFSNITNTDTNDTLSELVSSSHWRTSKWTGGHDTVNYYSAELGL